MSFQLSKRKVFIVPSDHNHFGPLVGHSTYTSYNHYTMFRFTTTSVELTSPASREPLRYLNPLPNYRKPSFLHIRPAGFLVLASAGLYLR